MKKKTEKKIEPRDPELEALLGAFREVHPRKDEVDGWKRAVRAELASANPASTSLPVVEPARWTWKRLVLRVAVPVGMAASLGFVIGAYVVEQRYNEGQAMLFSQTEPNHPPRALTTDEQREVVKLRFD